MNEAQLAAVDAAESEDGQSAGERLGRVMDPELWAMIDLRRAIYLECSKVLGGPLPNGQKLQIVHELTAPRNFQYPDLAVARLRRMVDDTSTGTTSSRAHLAVASDAFEDAARVIAGVRLPTGDEEPDRGSAVGGLPSEEMRK